VHAAVISWLAIIALAACSGDPQPRLAWGIGVRTFDAVELGLGTPALPDDPIAGVVDAPRLEIPTYDGSGQAVHPDVMVDGARLLMAMTPYPFANNRLENPSLVTSSGGQTFEALPGNPLADPPPLDHNDDPDLRRDPRTGEYELLYLETLRPDRQTVVALRSPDLVTWTRRDAIVYQLDRDPFIVSPAALEHAGMTWLFFVDLSTEPARIASLTSPDGLGWDKAAATPIAIELGAVSPWHIDVFPAAHGFAMLISGFDEEFARQSVYLATSPDLASWTLRPEPLLSPRDPTLDVETLYRSTGIVSGNRLMVWYSMAHVD
jgi:hypothetical protein